MSGRNTPIAKGYVDDLGAMLLALIAAIVIVFAAMYINQYSKVRNLQRRVAELEQRQ